MAAGDIGMKVIRATAGLVSELDPKKTLKMTTLKGLEKSNSRAYKAGAATGKFLFGGIVDSVGNMTKKEGAMGLTESIKRAHMTKITDPKMAKELGKKVGEYRVDAKKVAGTAIGISMAGRVATGGGLYRDRNGNFNIPGLPFI